MARRFRFVPLGRILVAYALTACSPRAVVVVAAIVGSGLLVPSAEASFPGGNGRLAFAASTGGFSATNEVLWDYDPRTNTRRKLTARDRRCGRFPNWRDGPLSYSPDGRRIAYVHGDSCRSDRSTWRYELRVMRADGSRNRLIVRSHSSSFGDQPFRYVNFSPDGRRVALFHGNDAFTVFDVTTRAAVGRGTTPDSVGYGTDWSPTGRLVASLSSGLFAFWPNGTGLRQLTSNHVGPSFESHERYPDWGPAGKAITFQRVWLLPEEDFGTDISRGAIWRVSPGRPALELRSTRGQQLGRPVVSPDGRRLALIRGEFGAIVTMPVTGSRRVRTLVRSGGPNLRLVEQSLDWQPLPRR